MRVDSFTKSYEGSRVLSFPGTEFENGKIYAVIGANGSGKSTMAKVISGLEKCDEGSKPAQCQTVGYMPQKSFAFRMSTEKNIALNGKDREKAGKLARRLGLDNLLDRRAKKLSGGETAKMALVRLMMKHYDMLVLDEPTASMDMESTLESENLIKMYCREENCPVVLITHSIQQARRIADEVLFLDRGVLAETGETQEMLSNPKDDRTARFINFYGI